MWKAALRCSLRASRMLPSLCGRPIKPQCRRKDYEHFCSPHRFPQTTTVTAKTSSLQSAVESQEDACIYSVALSETRWLGPYSGDRCTSALVPVGNDLGPL